MVAVKISNSFLPLLFLLGLLISSAGNAKTSLNQYADEISQAEELGKIIYDKDIAAWVGTDKMLVDLGNDVSGLPIQGWVTDQVDGHYRVNFIGEKDGKTKIYYQAWVKGKRVEKTKIHKQGVSLSENQVIMWAARQLALRQNYEKCSLTYNTVVVPYGDANAKKLYTYIFASTTDPSKIVMGGHYRYSMSLDGQKVLSNIAFSNSCMELDKDTSALAMVVTHLKTNFPQEHHVFIGLSHGMDLYVSAAKIDAMYKIHNGKIEGIHK